MKEIKYSKKHSFLFVFSLLIFLILGGGFLFSPPPKNLFPSQQKWSYYSLPFSSQDKVLVISPHPDDAALATAGVIQKAEEIGAQVKVVYITCGEHNTDSLFKENKLSLPSPVSAIALGNRRHQEAEKAMRDLGLKKNQTVFLGFPDFGTLKIWVDHFTSHPYFSGQTLHNDSFYPFVYKKGISFSAQDELSLLEEIISGFQPTKIFYPALSDLNSDHRATGLFVQAALFDLRNKIHPQEYQYFVHAEDWPLPSQFAPFSYLLPPYYIKNLPLNWSLAELNKEEELKKDKAINEHKSQVKVKPYFMKSFVRKNELFLNRWDSYPDEQLPLWSKEEMQKIKIIPVIRSVSLQDNQDYVSFDIILHKGVERFVQMDLFVYPLQENKKFAQSPKYKITIKRGSRDTIKITFQDRYKKVFLRKEEKIIRKGQYLMIKVNINKKYFPGTENIFSAIEVELAHLRISETPWWNIRLLHSAIDDTGQSGT